MNPDQSNENNSANSKQRRNKWKNLTAFNRPIPGTVTLEVGARPWQNPSQFSRVEEAAEDYLQRMTSQSFLIS